MLKKIIAGLLVSVSVVLSSGLAMAQGTVPIALQTVVDQTGRPIAGALLYFYQAGTVATRQDSFQDTGLTQVNQWPLPTDAFGRVPMFYVASGSIHIRLTDAGGGQIFDIPNALVIGPSGGGGGGAAVDPTTIFATGDMKFRPTGETLTGWVKANGQTIGSAASGATGRANADTQNLFISLWNNCTNAHCPVSSGRGASALADFNANKTLQVYDCRGRICGVGVDDMGNSAAGNLLAQNIFSGGDTPTTTAAQAGENNHTLTLAQLPATAATSPPTFSGTNQAWTINQGNIPFNTVSANSNVGAGGIPIPLLGNVGSLTVNVIPAGTISGGQLGSGASHNVLSLSLTGTWYLKL